MVLRIYNTLGRKKQVFKPLKGKKVRMYSCGPTVYDLPHIGNYLSFTMADTIKRYLEFKGYRVKHVMNITDIDDKTIKGSAKEKVSLKKFTDKYIKVFFDGLDVLNIKRAWEYPRATEHIEDMIKWTKVLIKKGYAYEKCNSVYYDISKFKDYGKLSKVDLKNIKVGATVDVDEYAKDSPQDFALLKRLTLEELKVGGYYDSPWGKIRPGWHIECSVMSTKYLGQPFDIHTGGVDLIFPHHENEIAQSEAYAGKPFVKYWIHNEHLIVNGEKMSKSKGNWFTLYDVVDKYGGEIVRFMFSSSHYRKKLNYTDEFVEGIKREYEKLKETLEKLERTIKKSNNKSKESIVIKQIDKIRDDFIKAMDDDFNTPKALRQFFKLSKLINRYIENGDNKKVLDKSHKTFKEFAYVFGIFEKLEKKILSFEDKELIKERERYRKEGKWDDADKIRAHLKKKDILLEDRKDGTTKWKIVK